MTKEKRRRAVALQRVLKNDESGLAGLFAGTAFARCAIRRQVFYWRAGEWSVLPVDLSRADGEREELPVLCDGCCSGGSRISAVFALPAGMFAGDTGVDGNFGNGFAGSAAD